MIIEYLLKSNNMIFGELNFPEEIHDCLVVTLDHRTPREVNINMTNYVKKIIQEYPGDFSTSAATPESEFLLKINNNTEKLKDRQRQYFHRTITRNLFRTKRARPEIHTAITYLSIRVIDTRTDYWNKLRHMMMYLLGTKDPVLRLNVEHLHVLK